MTDQFESSGRDHLTKELIRAALPTRWIAESVHFFEQVTSTNDILTDLAETGAPQGTLLIANFQTRGKGRLQRRWQAPPGSSLLFSLLFRPDWAADRTGWLTMMGGLAVLHAIESVCNLTPALKWPNDIMLETSGHWRKTGGLLLETSLSGEQTEWAVLGIGLNVNIPKPQLPQAATLATSLQAALGHATPRLPLLVHILQELERLYDLAAAGQSPQPQWNERLITLGRQVRIRAGNRTLEGVALGTDVWGRLLVRDAGQQVHTVAAGDVTLRGSPLSDDSATGNQRPDC